MVVPHVFLTRFNLPANPVEQKIYSQDWLNDRMIWFERFTVPSVRSQQRENVHWITYLDERSPDWLRQRLSELHEEGLVYPRYLSGALRPGEIQQDIRAAIGASEGAVTTSNLDNDDGLACDFVARLRGFEILDRPSALCLVNGLVLHGAYIYECKDPVNAFSGVAAELSVPDFKTCWSYFHNLLGNHMTVLRAEGPPAWLQVIHQRNVSNRVRGELSRPEWFDCLYPNLLNGLPTPTRAEMARDAVKRPFRNAGDRAIRAGVRGFRMAFGERASQRVKDSVQHWR